MRLFKNVDIKDLESILEKGILSMDACGNNNWVDKKRANNATDVVYLFKAKNIGDSFTRYGIALIEVDVDAKYNEITEHDANYGLYEEYITSKVETSQIKAIYIPEFFKSRIKINSDLIKFVDVDFLYWKDDDKVHCDDEIKENLLANAGINTSDELYLRGLKEKEIWGNTYKEVVDVDLDIQWTYKI